MSTQLILYPQTYDGTYNSVATPVMTEFVADGINFTDINIASCFDMPGGTIAQTQILTQQPPLIANTWYKWRSTSPTPACPTETGNNLVLNAVASAPASGSGVYQKLDNLVVGVSYTFQCTFDVPSVGIQYIRVYSGTAQQNIIANLQWSTTSPPPLTFVASSPNDIIMVSMFNTYDSNLTIREISVEGASYTADGVYSQLQDGQVICDLYQEEDIPLTLSIDDFKNVAEQVKSYSKDFNLPATKRNNKIFNNMFEVTRADDQIIFNPYLRTQCVLKQDGFILFEGYLRLVDVKDKEGEISYNVNLYSDVITLADILKDQTFAHLDFTELAHDYNKTQIKYSWNDSGTGITYLNPSTSGFRDAYSTVKYPFIDWTHQLLVGGSGSGSAATPGYPELRTLETAFRPCIQLKYLIDRIFADTNQFTYTSDFFDTTVAGGGSFDFDKLYMDFNWGGDNAPVVFGSTGELSKFANQHLTSSYTTMIFNDVTLFGFGTALSPNFGYDESTGVFTVLEDSQEYWISCHLKFAWDLLGSSLDVLDVEWYVNSVAVSAVTNITKPAPGVYNYIAGFSTGPLQAGDTILCRAKCVLGKIFLAKAIPGTVYFNLITAATSVNQVTNDVFLDALRGELGQWDFLKGIMTMFNLVSVVDETNANNILIEPYSDIFINNTNCSTTTSELTLACRSIQHDWTDKVDVSQMELKPLTDLNRNTLFKFVEDEDDYAFSVFKKSTYGHLYGSLLRESGFTILEGTEEITAEPFASTVSKPVMWQFADFVVPMLYAKNEDGTTEGFDNSPRILYNNGVKGTGVSYYIPPQNGLTSENQEDFLQFSHLSTIPSVSATTKDFVFASHQLPVEVGNPPTDNLYRTYWQPYFNELYHPDTRIMTLKVNLSPSDVASFKFYDTVFIKNRTFRVNRIDYKPNDLATVEFILIP
jgi:hypothetical protein